MERDDEHANGDRLRRERTRRRLTIAQVAQATKIRERYLVAIEADDLEELPNPVFAVGFIQIYARFLGLSPEPFVRAYKERIGDLSASELGAEPARSAYVPPHGRSFLLPALLVVLLLALAGYLYQQVAMYASGSATNPPPRGTGIALVIPTPLPSPPPPPSPTATPRPPTPTPRPTAKPATATPVAEASPTAASSSTPSVGVRIDTVINGRVWLQVEADGKVIFSGILTSGDKRTWTADKSLMLWSGNAGNVLVTLNGKSLGAMGPFGKVLKVTWTSPA
ncbi:MAG: helix-turn-helix domain-containing protein [Chloroflexota bacterium]